MDANSMIIQIAILIILASFAYLTYHDFKIALLVLLALLPTYLIRFSVGPVPTTLLECLVLIVLGFWFVRQNGYKLDFLRTMGPYRAPMLLLLAASCFSVVVAPDVFSALGIWKAFFIEPILLFFVFRSTLTERKDWESGFFALGGAVIVLSLFAVIQRLTGLGIPAPWDIELRATSFFDFPNALGLFIAPTVSASMVYLSGWFANSPSLRRRGLGGSLAPRHPRGLGVLAGVIAGLGLLACALSQTEAVFVAIPASLFLALFASNGSGWFARSPSQGDTGGRGVGRWLVPALALLFAFLAFTFIPVIREKLLLQDLSGQARLAQWSETSTYLKTHWLTGAGLSGYPTAIKPYHNPRVFEIFQFPHNILLNFWVELGLLGVIALVAFIVATLRLVGGGSKTRPYTPRDDLFVLMAFAALSTMFIHGLVDVPFFKNDLAILTSFFLGFALIPPPAPSGVAPTGEPPLKVGE